MKIITEPIKVLVKFGWASARYLKARSSKLLMLQRMKALSYLAQYPSCPIVASLCHYILRYSHHLHIAVVHYVRKSGALGVWDRSHFLKVLEEPSDCEPISISTRLLFERLFDISVEVQIKCEEYFNACRSLMPFSLPWLMVPEVIESYSNSYVARGSCAEHRMVFLGVEPNPFTIYEA
jgi:hypothetical protein